MIWGQCYICGKKAMYICKNCGRPVCKEHYIPSVGLCTNCAQGKSFKK